MSFIHRQTNKNWTILQTGLLSGGRQFFHFHLVIKKLLIVNTVDSSTLLSKVYKILEQVEGTEIFCFKRD